MRELLIVAFLFCLTSSIANAQEVIELNKPVKCGDAQWVMNHFTGEYGEKPVWVGKDANSNSYVTLLINRETRSWTLLQYDGKMACVLSVGQTASSVDI
jgi:hypothetical protein